MRVLAILVLKRKHANSIALDNIVCIKHSEYVCRRDYLKRLALMHRPIALSRHTRTPLCGCRRSCSSGPIPQPRSGDIGVGWSTFGCRLLPYPVLHTVGYCVGRQGLSNRLWSCGSSVIVHKAPRCRPMLPTSYPLESLTLTLTFCPFNPSLRSAFSSRLLHSNCLTTLVPTST
ncbi:hypothetical protein FKP32DRAFT_1351007 [Trametes sanguinea]|nr:hypothetical protein FKP32DRAFT_1351007 [Trametes sanguinea]